MFPLPKTILMEIVAGIETYLVKFPKTIMKELKGYVNVWLSK
jgi:hypothetical protein